MEEHRTRIVVGEGQTLRKGLLRFVLEGEGYDVVAEARSSAELARMVAVHEPDVVVLDDGIGATAVQMARELAPRAKVILVWPGAVVPIGGDARVDPAEVLKELAAAVAKVTARPAPLTETFRKPAWIDRVRKDPSTLRDLLEKGGGLPRRPSVTELQRRGQRLHPVDKPDEADRAEGDESEKDPEGAGEKPPAARPGDTDRPSAPVVILPVPGAGAPGSDEPILVVATEGSDDVPTEPEGVDAERQDLEDEGDVAGSDETGVPVGAAADAATSRARDDDRAGAVIALPPGDAAGADGTSTSSEPDDAATSWQRRLGTIALGGAAAASALILALSLTGSRIPADVLAGAPPVGAEAPQPFDGSTGVLDPDGTAGPAPDAPVLAFPTGSDDGRVSPPGEPPTGEPPTGEPPTGEPPTGEPPTGEPPTGEPPTVQDLPGASESNRHNGPPGITGNEPDTPAGNGGSNAGGNGNGNGPPSSHPGQGPPDPHPGQGGGNGAGREHGHSSSAQGRNHAHKR